MDDCRKPFHAHRRSHRQQRLESLADAPADEHVAVIGHADYNAASAKLHFAQDRGRPQHRIIEKSAASQGWIIVHESQNVPLTAILIHGFETLDQILRGPARAVDNNVPYRHARTPCSTQVFSVSVTVRICWLRSSGYMGKERTSLAAFSA